MHSGASCAGAQGTEQGQWNGNNQKQIPGGQSARQWQQPEQSQGPSQPAPQQRRPQTTTASQPGEIHNAIIGHEL